MHEELSLQILDIAMNSLSAGAKTVSIGIQEDAAADRLTIRIHDDGQGMDTAQLHEVLERSRSFKACRAKGVGLGLAFLRQTADMCEGTFGVESQPGQGTTVTATMRPSHPDLPPMGDLPTTILVLCAAGPAVDVRLDYRGHDGAVTFSSAELEQPMVHR